MRYKPVYFLLTILVIATIAFTFLPGFSFIGYTIYEDSGSGFSAGIFENTTLNDTSVVLSGTNVTGSFTSSIFDSSSVSKWNNLSFISSGQDPVIFVRSCDDSACTNDAWNQIILSNFSNLSIQDRRYFQYRALFYSTSNGSTVLSNVYIDYTILPISIWINVTSPESGAVYGYNSSLLLNYTVTPSPASCKYSLDGKVNVSLPGCLGSSFDVSSNGTHSLTLYAIASDGNVSFKTVNFNVYPDYPTVIPISPPDGSTYNSSLQFNYYVNDSDLTGCSLFANFTGSWGASDTNNSPSSGEINTFSQTPNSDGTYSWGVECDDISAQAALTLNRTVSIDRVAPAVQISQPSGTFNSRAGIPVSLSVVDATTVTCVYTLSKAGAGAVLVVVMPQCQSTSFNVADDGQYTMTVTAADSGGNTNTQTSSFIVQSDSSSSESNSGGGGGGGGGGGTSVNIESLVVPRVSFGNIDPISLKPGFSDYREVEIINSGNKFLNNCHLVGEGEYANWINSTHLESLGTGQRGIFDLGIKAPRNAQPGDMLLPIGVKCDEVEKVTNISLSISSADYLFDILGYYRKGTALVVNYSLQDLTGTDQTIKAHYSLHDSNNLEVAFGDTELKSKASSTIDSSFSFELPKDSYGEFTLSFDTNTPNDKSSVSLPILITANGATGLAISDNNKRTLALWGAIVIIAGAVYGAWYFARRIRLNRQIAGNSI